MLEDKDGPWAALIHNGVVAKDGLRFEQSTCDSEGILNAMRDENALYVPENLQDALDRIYGYYALGVMVHTYEGWAVDVIKDGTAHLTALYVAELDAVVFATSPDHVTAACKQLKWRRPARAKLRDNVRVRFDATTGAALVTDTFEPRRRCHTPLATTRTTAGAGAMTSPARTWRTSGRRPRNGSGYAPRARTSYNRGCVGFVLKSGVRARLPKRANTPRLRAICVTRVI